MQYLVENNHNQKAYEALYMKMEHREQLEEELETSEGQKLLIWYRANHYLYYKKLDGLLARDASTEQPVMANLGNLHGRNHQTVWLGTNTT